MKLIPDWKLAWRFLSVQAAVLLALLSGLQAEVLPLLSPLFPEHVWPWVSGGLALSVVVLRLVSQDGLREDRSRLEMERELDALDAHADAPAEGLPTESPPAASSGQPMPPGRLECYLGAATALALGVVIGLMVLGIWALWSAP